MKKFFAVICVSFLAALMVFAGIRTKSPPVPLHDMNGFAVSDMGIPGVSMPSENMVITNPDVYAVSTLNLVIQTPRHICAEGYQSQNLINGINTNTGNKGVIRPNLWPMTYSGEVSFYNQGLCSNKAAETCSKERSIVILPECSVNLV